MGVFRHFVFCNTWNAVTTYSVTLSQSLHLMITINYYTYSITIYNLKLRPFQGTPVYNKGIASPITQNIRTRTNVPCHTIWTSHNLRVETLKRVPFPAIRTSELAQVFYFRPLEFTQAFYTTKSEHQNSHNQTTSRNPQVRTLKCFMLRNPLSYKQDWSHGCVFVFCALTHGMSSWRSVLFQTLRTCTSVP